MICTRDPHGPAHSMNARTVSILEKIWKKMENFFQTIWRDSRRRTPLECAVGIMKFFGKNFPKAWEKFSKTFSKKILAGGFNHTQGNYEIFVPGHNFFGKNDVLLRNTIYVIYVTYSYIVSVVPHQSVKNFVFDMRQWTYAIM